MFLLSIEEGTFKSCPFEWNGLPLNVVTYNVSAFFAFYLFPYTVIIYTNISLFKTVMLVYFLSKKLMYSHLKYFKVNEMTLHLKKSIKNDDINKRLVRERGSIILTLVFVGK